MVPGRLLISTFLLLFQLKLFPESILFLAIWSRLVLNLSRDPEDATNFLVYYIVCDFFYRATVRCSVNLAARKRTWLDIIALNFYRLL